ncbi:hypothetical protein Cni_G27012 [Canna indica]|uniref:E3 ubiquitin-protein ligase RMA n=1 Tax=Canna indica TaxID=4628 RepID=A0AAQ3L0Y8_9LILI|nr:hypothetical protein Cni_G27012 [Canna indica]
MEVQDISQTYITQSCSYNNAQEEDPSTCNKAADAAPAPSMNGCFDCNICLEFVANPVVTLCGHLYCWPCIYKWMQVETISHQQCPVCKAFLSEDTIVPLYGRGGDNTKANSNVPHRPVLHLHRNHTVTASAQRPRIHQHHHQSNASLGDFYVFDQSSSLTAPLFRSTAGGLLGGLAVAILPWVCRNHGMRLYYADPSYFLTLSGNSPRLRRQQMQLESSLHQIWLFLLCCVMMCLLLF